MTLEPTDKYSYEGCLLQLKGRRQLQFDYPIGEVLEFGEVIVVRLEVPVGTVYNENVFGVSCDGKVVWQVEKREWVRRESPYTGLSRKEKMVCLYNYEGFLVCLDPFTGQVIKEEFTR